MKWKCVICDKLNDLNNYCYKCHNLNKINNEMSVEYNNDLISKYNQINRVIDNLTLTKTDVPHYIIDFNLMNILVNILHPNHNLLQEISRNLLLNHITYRLYHKSNSSWVVYRRSTTKKKYKKILFNRLIILFNVDVLNIILDYL